MSEETDIECQWQFLPLDQTHFTMVNGMSGHGSGVFSQAGLSTRVQTTLQPGSVFHHTPAWNWGDRTGLVSVGQITTNPKNILCVDNYLLSSDMLLEYSNHAHWSYVTGKIMTHLTSRFFSRAGYFVTVEHKSSGGAWACHSQVRPDLDLTLLQRLERERPHWPVRPGQETQRTNEKWLLAL